MNLLGSHPWRRASAVKKRNAGSTRMHVLRFSDPAWIVSTHRMRIDPRRPVPVNNLPSNRDHNIKGAMPGVTSWTKMLMLMTAFCTPFWPSPKGCVVPKVELTP